MHHPRLRSTALPVLVATLGLLVAGCSSLPRTPYSVADASSARVLDLVDLRRNADEPAGKFMQTNHQAVLRGPRTYLALSGGGADGAYGAGVLNGWSEAGTRPSFSVVSGVSTGALIAPFAFLGSEYDATVREIYTSGIAASLLEDPNPLKAIFGSGLFGNAKMRDLAAKYYDANVVAAVAVEYAKGRQLAIVTTNIDSQRTVIWDMGRIASLGTPESLRLFQDVVAASASVPVVFEPMLITAAANGSQFQEMHIDGGVTAPVLTLPEAFLLRNAAPAKPENLQLFILINNKVEREFQLVTNSTVEIAARSSSTMLKTQTRSILYNTYAFARRNKFGFNLTYIEGDRPLSPAGFDTAYMRELFQYGYDRARSGHVWSQSPPADNNEAPSASRIAAAR
ncbi:patatin-like phospholipase family protein [Rhodopseudomonas palustris]|uniref:Patatin-like phospholipase domain n=1 Tax=Rhodopseudomonas palustris (strain ATCC BAA-98 / CGA009) TaxID=258594 RepID=Q6N2G1_RHOPA|nr:patatin-like phospholipase family protein [Rhodopseudomonas palustris]OPF92505.1 alpha/beta hydrolase [Rhodopseudomonas palustris]RJF63880.1 alpha/beta hydrolase [Rhodopseudomonas palustris]WAB76980.1 patatin-like phospholipase family protein [Rhodopseudomonas palustris]WCL94275.1 patatin-like phospholipase family protein [Rhodopseudomonas palustris CGA009]WND50892.1 patatin-like phospholipase family protein [Rhodopseudomonas palustris]